MYLIPLAWFYVVLMMTIAEATSTQGSVLGAAITFFLYGVLPITLVVYLMGTPLRRKKRARDEALQDAQVRAAAEQASNPPDAGGHAASAADIACASGAVTPVRKED
jgi:hypothetical protein